MMCPQSHGGNGGAVGTQRLRPGLALFVWAVVLLLGAGRSAAADFDFAKFHHELGCRLAYGKNAKDADVRIYGVMPRFGWVLLKPGNPCWAGFGVSLVLEAIFTVADAEKTGGEVGLTPLVKISYPLARRALLFVEGGAGVIGEFFDSPAVPHSFNFTPQVGAGVELALKPQLALTAAYRFRHSSNASLYAENPAFDVHLFQAGITYYF